MQETHHKHNKGAFHTNMEIMTNKRIMSMIILDSEKHIRLLQDIETGFYVVFNGRFNQTHYAKSYQMAEKRFNRLIALS